MQVYKVHKRRVLAVVMTMGAVVLLAAVATINSPQMLDMDWTYGGGDDYEAARTRNDSLSSFKYEILSESNESLASWNESKQRDVSEQKVARRNEAEEEEDLYGEERYGEVEGSDDVLGEYDDRNEDVVGEYDDYGSENEDEEEEDEENDNGVFRDGDFDNQSTNYSIGSSDVRDPRTRSRFRGNSTIRTSTRDLSPPTDESDDDDDDVWDKRIVDRKLHSKSENEARITKTSQVVSQETSPEETEASKLVKRTSGMNPVAEDSIFWSSELESLAPKGFSDEYVHTFQKHMRRLTVTNMESPTWNRCGRPKNQFVTLSDGSHVCARYRCPHDYLVQGEVLSFYLARLLGIRNVPIVVLSRVDPLSEQWNGNGSMDSLLGNAEWELNTTVAFIQWISGLERDRMPDMIRNALQSGKTITGEQKRLRDAPQDTLIDLLQWSNLIVFDYITGNYDRVASMQDAAEKELRPALLSDTIHNLVKSRSNKGLWLIDNESGLLDAYSLMYSRTHPTQGQRFVEYQSQMLRTNCLFSRTVYKRVETLSRSRNAHRQLLDYVFREEPLFGDLPDVDSNVDFAKQLQQRVDEVYEWMISCQHRPK